MTPSRLKWEAFAGFALPILLCWFSLLWMLVLSIWLSDLNTSIKSSWIILAIALMWVTFVPMISYEMGILSAYCWQHQPWGHIFRSSMVNTFSAYFWAFSFPLALILVCSVFGMLVFPIQMVCYERGVKLGEKWIEDRAFDKFFGKKNDWERE